MKVEPIASANDDDTKGFRYYEYSPYLIITSSTDGDLTTRLQLIEDNTKLRSIKPYNFAASSEFSMEFTNGVLTSAKAVVDETVIPKSIVAGLEKAATAALKSFNAPSAVSEFPQPYIFKILQDDQGNWRLAGDNTNRAPIQISPKFE